MFGFLSPRQHIPEWRRSYARICQHQRSLFGLTSLPFLSYEATFLYQLAIDFRLISPLPRSAPECCRLRRIPKSDSRHDRTAAIYAAAFGMMLAGVKLRDDVEDSGRWYHRLAEWKYRRQTQHAEQFIASFAPEVPQRVRAAICAHTQLESASPIELEEYSDPTAEGFAAVFRGFVQSLIPADDIESADTFEAIGRHLGKAIISWDCAVDFEKDRIHGEFNPLSDAAGVRRSFDYCVLQLAQIGWLVPRHSTCETVIQNVLSRVRRRRTSAAQHPVRTLERWGLVREQGHAYARCDGCDAICAVGECCECIGGAGEAATGCGECCGQGGQCASCAPGCDCAVCCDGCGLCGSKKTPPTAGHTLTETESQQPYEQYRGKTGFTDGSLNPAGYVSVDGEKIPAKTASGTLLDSGVPVTVVSTDAFGVTVRPDVES